MRIQKVQGGDTVEEQTKIHNLNRQTTSGQIQELDCKSQKLQATAEIVLLSVQILDLLVSRE